MPSVLIVSFRFDRVHAWWGLNSICYRYLFTRKVFFALTSFLSFSVSYCVTEDRGWWGHSSSKFWYKLFLFPYALSRQESFSVYCTFAYIFRCSTPPIACPRMFCNGLQEKGGGIHSKSIADDHYSARLATDCEACAVRRPEWFS